MEAVLEHGHDGMFEPVAPIMPAADGTYAVELEVHEPGAYRVRAGELDQPGGAGPADGAVAPRPGAPRANVRLTPT